MSLPLPNTHITKRRQLLRSYISSVGGHQYWKHTYLTLIWAPKEFYYLWCHTVGLHEKCLKKVSMWNTLTVWKWWNLHWLSFLPLPSLRTISSRARNTPSRPTNFLSNQQWVVLTTDNADFTTRQLRAIDEILSGNQERISPLWFRLQLLFLRSIKFLMSWFTSTWA